MGKRKYHHHGFSKTGKEHHHKHHYRRARGGEKQKDQVGPDPKMKKAPNPGIGLKMPAGLFSGTPATQFIPSDVRKSNANKLMIESERYLTPSEERSIGDFALKQKTLVEHLKEEAHMQAIGKHAEWETKKASFQEDMNKAISNFGLSGQIALMNQVKRQLSAMSDEMKEDDRLRDDFGTTYHNYRKQMFDFNDDIVRSVTNHHKREMENPSGNPYAPFILSLGVNGISRMESMPISEWGKINGTPRAAAGNREQTEEDRKKGKEQDMIDFAVDYGLNYEDVQDMLAGKHEDEEVFPEDSFKPKGWFREGKAFMDKSWSTDMKNQDERGSIMKWLTSNPYDTHMSIIKQVHAGKTDEEVMNAITLRRKHIDDTLSDEAIQGMEPQQKRDLLHEAELTRFYKRHAKNLLLMEWTKRRHEKKNAELNKTVNPATSIMTTAMARNQAAYDQESMKGTTSNLDAVGKVLKGVGKGVLKGAGSALSLYAQADAMFGSGAAYKKEKRKLKMERLKSDTTTGIAENTAKQEYARVGGEYKEREKLAKLAEAEATAKYASEMAKANLKLKKEAKKLGLEKVNAMKDERYVKYAKLVVGGLGVAGLGAATFLTGGATAAAYPWLVPLLGTIGGGITGNTIKDAVSGK
jgi:hypothetical protein